MKICFIHDAKTDAQREEFELFADMISSNNRKNDEKSKWEL